MQIYRPKKTAIRVDFVLRQNVEHPRSTKGHNSLLSRNCPAEVREPRAGRPCRLWTTFRRGGGKNVKKQKFLACDTAALQVEKRREDTQKSQHAAREKDKRARARKEKRDAKRREAQAKSRKTGEAVTTRYIISRRCLPWLLFRHMRLRILGRLPVSTPMYRVRDLGRPWPVLSRVKHVINAAWKPLTCVLVV